MIEYKTQNFSPAEILEAARIQIRELPEGFLSSLGEQPLYLVFKHAADSEYGILILAKDRDKVAGYVMGATNTSKFYVEFLRKRSLVALRYFLPKLISVQRLLRAFETLLYPSRRSVQTSTVQAELLDLAVTQEYQGKGIASQLFDLLVEMFQQKGIRRFQIPTSEGLERAHRFYEKKGAHCVGSIEVHKGAKTLIYLYEMPGGEHDAAKAIRTP